MKIIRPLQIAFNHRVLEHDRRFFFVASATLAVNLQSGEALLETDAMKDAIPCMGERPLPDIGMPKPMGELLVSGSFYPAPNTSPTEGWVRIRFGELEKTLVVHGSRQWRHGLISKAEPITVLPIDYAYAFGGPEYAKNPLGMGFKDGWLPRIEDPDYPILSPRDRPEPSGLGPMDPSWPQRMRFQGTYDKTYLKTSFPGYPADFDHRFFMCAPEDQWMDRYLIGNEVFGLYNMHPEHPVIEGKLPGYYPSCFIRHTLEDGESVIARIPMELDTVWFFPEKLMAHLIWRGMTEVMDDEADQISHVMLAYEDRAQQPRSDDYYLDAFQRRLNSDDVLLNSLNTEDLIPAGAKSAMELFQEMAFESEEKSALADNIEAKMASVQNMVNGKMDEAMQIAEKQMAETDFKVSDDFKDHIPDAAKAFVPGEGKIDLRKMMDSLKDEKPKEEPDVVELKQNLESMLPGITSGDPQAISLKHFSFDKIEKIMDEVKKFTDKKQDSTMEMVRTEIAKAKEGLADQIEESGGVADAIHGLPEETKAKLSELYESMNILDGMDKQEKTQTPLPRMKTDDILEELARIPAQLPPEYMDAMQHVETMKSMGVAQETIEEMENQLGMIIKGKSEELEHQLRESERNFKDSYIMGAHFMENGLSPHKDPPEAVANRLLDAIAEGQDVSGGDWACIDLSGKKLSGVNLSGAFLEQVDLSGADLTGANLSKAILARAILDGADLSGANLEEANIGGVRARGADFTGAHLKSAKLSKGDFSEAKFVGCDLESVETIEIIVNGTDFAEAQMPSMRFIESEITGTIFSRARMDASLFFDCTLRDVSFSEASAPRCVFADSRLFNVVFDGADVTSVCFVATDPDKCRFEKVRFHGARMDKGCFQGMRMPGIVLTEASMENALFNKADLTGGDLAFSLGRGVQFRKARLVQARLDHANLMEGSLAGAELTDASLTGANLYAADMLRVLIENTDFTGSNRERTLMAEEE